jgi:Ni,Fe-hydrogenase III small subunit
MFRHIDMLILVLSLVADGATTLPKIFYDIPKPTALMPCGTVAHTTTVEVTETASHSVDEIC